MIKLLDHIGIVTGKLERAKEGLEALFGPAEERLEVKNVGLKAHIFRAGNVSVELINFEKEPEGIDSEVYNPKEGIHHLAFRVDDLDESVRKLKNRGFHELKGFPREGIHGKRITFLKGPWDFLVELVEWR